jgi:predicted nucleotide-binding protein (sugar kinase/HSP70/actin superfamily)
MTNVNCDECKEDFELSLQTKVVERDIQLAYFTCPHCSKEYQSYYSNNKTRTRGQRIRELYGKLKLIRNERQQKQMMERIEQITLLNKKEMEELKSRYA